MSNRPDRLLVEQNPSADPMDASLLEQRLETLLEKQYDVVEESILLGESKVPPEIDTSTEMRGFRLLGRHVRTDLKAVVEEREDALTRERVGGYEYASEEEEAMRRRALEVAVDGQWVHAQSTLTTKKLHPSRKAQLQLVHVPFHSPPRTNKAVTQDVIHFAFLRQQKIQRKLAAKRQQPSRSFQRRNHHPLTSKPYANNRQVIIRK